MSSELIYNNSDSRFAIKKNRRGYTVFKELDILFIPDPNDKDTIVITSRENVKQGFIQIGRETFHATWGRN